MIFYFIAVFQTSNIRSLAMFVNVIIIIVIVIVIVTSCGAGQNKPRPFLPPLQLTCYYASPLLPLSECNWLWAMAGDNRQLDLRPTDPFTRIDPKLNQVVPWSLHTFHENFRFLIMLLTKKERNRPKMAENNTPSPYRGRGNNIFITIMDIKLQYNLYENIRHKTGFATQQRFRSVARTLAGIILIMYRPTVTVIQ